MRLFLIFIIATLSLQAQTLEIYFDTPNLFYLDHNASLKYQAVEYTTKKRNKIKYKEHVIYTYDGNKTTSFPVKHYNRVKFLEEKHPLLSLIKRSERDSFLSFIKSHGVTYPLKLKYILETNDVNKTYKELYKEKLAEDSFFSFKIGYPYFVNLLTALAFGLFGFIIVLFLLKNRTRPYDDK